MIMVMRIKTVVAVVMMIMWGRRRRGKGGEKMMTMVMNPALFPVWYSILAFYCPSLWFTHLHLEVITYLCIVTHRPCRIST